jgi:hypothetical protein
LLEVLNPTDVLFIQLVALFLYYVPLPFRHTLFSLLFKVQSDISLTHVITTLLS